MRVKLTNSDKQTTNKKWTQTKQKRKKIFTLIMPNVCL